MFDLEEPLIICSPENTLPIRFIPGICISITTFPDQTLSKRECTHGFASLTYVPPSGPAISSHRLLMCTSCSFKALFSFSDAVSFQLTPKLRTPRPSFQAGCTEVSARPSELTWPTVQGEEALLKRWSTGMGGKDELTEIEARGVLKTNLEN